MRCFGKNVLYIITYEMTECGYSLGHVYCFFSNSLSSGVEEVDRMTTLKEFLN